MGGFTAMACDCDGSLIIRSRVAKNQGIQYAGTTNRSQEVDVVMLLPLH